CRWIRATPPRRALVQPLAITLARGATTRITDWRPIFRAAARSIARMAIDTGVRLQCTGNTSRRGRFTSRPPTADTTEILGTAPWEQPAEAIRESSHRPVLPRPVPHLRRRQAPVRAQPLPRDRRQQARVRA